MQQTRENLITGRPMPARSFELLTSGGEPGWRDDRREARTRQRHAARRAAARDLQARKLVNRSRP